MRSLIFIILAGYAVRCDDASYYVIEMPEESQREFAKPFRVYWNVPSMQCKSKKIPFQNLFEKYGIMQNSGDSFLGEKVSILYDPGLFPALLKNETSGKFKFRNGGVPQEGDLEKHLVAFRSALEQSIPDERFSGIGIIDFESWRPVFRQNFGILIPYKDISYQIERKLHWFWTERAIQARARQRFEESARAFMQTTLSVAKQMRPRALWGYYGFPYCFNMASNNMVESCADKVGQENDRIFWLWSESTALYPSVYSSKELSSSQLAALVRGRVAEAARTKRRGTPILPYFWFRYRDGGFLSQTDLNTVLETLYKSDASGFIIWGSSNDVNTVDKCNKLLKYTTKVLGPAIAKYTKPNSIRNTTDSGTTYNPVSSIGLTTWRPVLKDHLNNSNSSKKPVFLDPEYHWDPPENYTQDIAHYVEQEFKKKPGYNDNTGNQTAFELHSKMYALIELILNFFKHNVNAIENDTHVISQVGANENKTTQARDFATSTSNTNDLGSSTSTPILLTQNPLDVLKARTKHLGNSEKDLTTSSKVETSTFKLNEYITLTTPFPYNSKGYSTFTEKGTESSDKDTANNSQENTTEKINGTNYIDNNEKHDINLIEQLDELLGTGTSTTEVDPSKITPTLSLNLIENVTEISLSTENDGVTSTSQLSNVPLNIDDIENKLSTLTYEEILNDYLSHTTENDLESMSTYSTTIPDTTLASKLHLSEKKGNKPLKNNKKGHYIYRNVFEITERTTSNSQNIESTTEPVTNSDTISTVSTELNKKIIYDEPFSIEFNKTSTYDIVDDILALEANLTNIINKEQTTTEISNTSENLVKGIKDSVNNILTVSTESSTPENFTKSTTDFAALTNSENVPDSITEDIRIEANTSDGVTTATDEDPQVVVFL